MKRRDAIQLMMDLERLNVSFSMHYRREDGDFEFGVPTVGIQRLSEGEARKVKEIVDTLDLDMEPTLYGAHIR